MIPRLCILGVGLIGGSLGLALKRTGSVGEIVAYEKNPAYRAKALALGIIDRAESHLAAALKNSDIVMLAVPLGAMSGLLREMTSHLPDNAVITDVGSVKGNVVAAAYAELGPGIVNFVPGHPIAGTEKNGPEAAFADLFRDHKVILTPLPENRVEAVEAIRVMWRQVGAEVVETTVEHHDQLLAGTSHLPHVLAYTLVDLLVKVGKPGESLQFAAGGFRDFSRIASSDPSLWRDICLANQAPLLMLLERFGNELQVVSEAIRQRNGEQLLEIFSRAKTARDFYYDS